MNSIQETLHTIGEKIEQKKGAVERIKANIKAFEEKPNEIDWVRVGFVGNIGLLKNEVYANYLHGGELQTIGSIIHTASKRALINAESEYKKAHQELIDFSEKIKITNGST